MSDDDYPPGVELWIEHSTDKERVRDVIEASETAMSIAKVASNAYISEDEAESLLDELEDEGVVNWQREGYAIDEYGIEELRAERELSGRDYDYLRNLHQFLTHRIAKVDNKEQRVKLMYRRELVREEMNRINDLGE